MDEHPQPGQAFMSALVTEHFVLQSARSTTTSEAVGRSAVYLACVSSSLVAFGFFAAATHRLAPVVATVLPALIILGLFTFVRLVETAVQDTVLDQRVAAIRHYYATLDPAAAALFPSREDLMASGRPTSTGKSFAMPEMFFTSASMIAAVNGIVIAAGAAAVADAAGVTPPATVIVGVAAALLAYGLHMLWMHHRGGPAMAYR
jgi:hypothetical protein